MIQSPTQTNPLPEQKAPGAKPQDTTPGKKQADAADGKDPSNTIPLTGSGANDKS